MRIICLSLCIFTMIFHGTPAAAGQSEQVTLSDVLARAASHTALLAGDAEIGRREAAVRLAGDRGPTTVAIEAENVGGSLPGFSEGESTILVKRPLLDGKRAHAEKDLARAALEQARQTSRSRLWEVTSAVQTAFHRALASAELEKAASEAVHLAERGLDAARTRAEAGAAPGSEILKARVELERARVELERSGSRFLEARAELARAVGQPGATDLTPIGTLTAELSLPDRVVLSENMRRLHPDLQELDTAENERKARAKAVDAGRRPQWAAGGGFRRFQEDDRHTFVIELEAELPDRRTARREKADLEGEARRIEAERNAREFDLDRELESQITRFSGARSSVRRLGASVLPDTNRLMEMALEGYRLGKADQLAVIEAQKAHLESRREYIEALGELYEAADAIESLCGVCLVGEHH